LLHGQIWLGGICFPIELFNHFKYDGGIELLKVWVLISGFPQYLWKYFEIKKNCKRVWGVLLEVDLRCARHIDFNVLRITIAVPRKESIPKARDIIFFDDVT
jgi:hypothetical protein